jgi:hypothetical protein
MSDLSRSLGLQLLESIRWGISGGIAMEELLGTEIGKHDYDW